MVDVIPPLVPVIVNVYVFRVENSTEDVTVMVEDPLPEIVAGLNVALPPLGAPLAESVTVPVNPAPGTSVTV